MIRGAREHNLRGVDVELPRGALVVITGVSGSGKSSLAFDTIYQEGQRRFVESLSSYARQFLGAMERPKVDSVEGISPTLSIDQKTVNRNPRSTVGTVTEVLDHLRLLYARLGVPRCPACATEVSRLGLDQVVDRLIASAQGQRALVLGPVVRERKGEYRKDLESLRLTGWTKARIDGVLCELDAAPALARYEKHTIEVVVDRLRIDLADRGRLAEACETAARLGGGTLVLSFPDGDRPDVAFSTTRACPHHPEVSIPELEPRLFSFNAPQGACAACNGMGGLEAFDPDLLIDRTRPGADACMAFSDGKIPFASFDAATWSRVLVSLGIDPEASAGAWTLRQREQVLRGAPGVTYTYTVERSGRSEHRVRPWRGLVPLLDEVFTWASGLATLQRLRRRSECPDCQGARLNAIAREVVFRGRRIWELTGLPVGEAAAWFAELALTGAEVAVGAQIVQEIRGRLDFLREVGLGYLTLDRRSASLSGGEAQRIRLAAQVGSALQGVTYVLDEPSIGLHARDNRRLLGALGALRDRGNTVIVVEHDAETIQSADWLVDVGPGAGRSGGLVLASGPPGHVIGASSGPTGRWLRGEVAIAHEPRRTPSSWLTVRGARANNLTGIDVRFPLGVLCVVTGVSGSGKSSLVFESLMDGVESALGRRSPASCDAVEGVGAIDKLVELSQTPIGRTPRSNPATYVGAFDLIRDLFAATPESKARGYKKGRFSFNVAGGRCEACEGAGHKTVELQFLPSVEVPCEVCNGKRFNAETLEITWRGRTISDVLAMTIDEASEVFGAIPKLARILGAMREVGLGYLPLGQPSTTVSGGEAQRLKIATELQRPPTGRTLYLLDEPTTGLHFDDVTRLVAALRRLVAAGNSVIVVEHHTDVIRVADHLVDLGPEGGAGGGRVVGEGRPEALARLDTPTGRVLASLPELGGVLLAADSAVAPRGAPAPAAIRVRGARAHNLRGIDVDIPHGRLTVITGPSGSGKTSLAFDTLFAEGQRQYVESLSTYARRFLGRMDRAPVDRIEGLQPAIAIDQRNAGHNPRSTVGTVTEIHDVLRLLWARVGVPHCPRCARVVRAWSPSEAAAALARQPGAGWLLAELPAAADPAARRAELRGAGWARIWSEGERDLADDATEPALGQPFRLVVDRLDPSTASRERVADALARAFAAAGRAIFRSRQGVETLFETTAACPEHGPVIVGALTPRHFSFNSQIGACTACQGLGSARVVQLDRLFVAPHLSFWESLDPRAAAALGRSARGRALIARVLGAESKRPVSRWSDALRARLLDGTSEVVSVQWAGRWGKSKRKVAEEKAWPGLLSTLEAFSGRMDWLFAAGPCRSCRGGRLRPAMLAVTVAGEGIAPFTARSVDSALELVARWDFGGEAGVIAERPLLELVRRLGFLSDVGLGYLGLDRAADTLSGGESQRIRLASQLGSALTGTTYVLDEPTIGLHPRDTARLLTTLEGLRDLGNTVILVEHDSDTIRRADHVIDLGPLAGVQGGSVVSSGTPAEILADPASLTGRWLSGAERIAPRAGLRASRGWITVREPRGNNLRGGVVRFPIGVLTAVTGVSGSGKSTLVLDTLAPAIRALRGASGEKPAPMGSIEADELPDEVIVVDQAPIGRTPRSTPATYTGVFDGLRRLYAETPAAKLRGWEPGRFSYNVPGGRCELCEGRGATLVEMHFLPDVWVTCDACGGRRYNRETLEVRWRDRSIADLLAMRIDEAVALFSAHRAISRALRALADVGLGYLTLGQPATTLSGGEAQRVKLATGLTSRQGRALYVLDEPTTGLHLSDVAQLLAVLHRLVDAGHTVITIEHHLSVIAQADHLIDLGPEGGAAGGRVVGEGSPAAIARLDTPTGRALR